MHRVAKVWVLSAVLCLVCLTMAAQVGYADDGSFTIRPYLFSSLGQKIGLGWQYNTKPVGVTDGGQVELYRGDRLVSRLTAATEGGLSFVALPMPVCNFGNDVGYRVAGQTQLTPIMNIPCGDSMAPVRFTFLADTQEGVAYDRQFAEQIRSFPSSAILNGGDLVETGTDLEAWVGFFGAMESVGSSRILFPTPGNHEYRYNKDVPYWKHFFRTEAKDSHYSFDLGAAHIIALNSNFEDDPSQRDLQLNWLEHELSLPYKWKIVFFHHPPYSVGYFNGPLARRKEFAVLQDYFVPLFERYHVDIVMAGHIHLFETALKDNVHYLIVGPAGGKMGPYGNRDPYKLKADRVRSVVHLEVSGQYLRAMSTAIDGQVLDDLILRK